MAFQSAGEAGESSPARRSIVVPRAAIRQQDGRDVVWVVRDGRVERRAVTVGSALGDDVTLAAGASGGDRLVVEGAEHLTDGVKITETKP